MCETARATGLRVVERRGCPRHRRVHVLISDGCRHSKFARHGHILPIAALVLAGCASPQGESAYAAAQAGEANAASLDQPMLIDAASIDPGIPAPESVAGHVMGDGAIRYGPLKRYLRALADASPLVTLTPYAETHEGRTLYYLTSIHYEPSQE